MAKASNPVSEKHVFLPIGKTKKEFNPGDGVKGVHVFDYQITLIGHTEHVDVYVAESLGAEGKQLGQQVLLKVENDYLVLRALFGGVATPKMNCVIAPLSGNNDGSGGAYHYGCNGIDLYCDNEYETNGEMTAALFVAEASEVFQAMQAKGWDCGASNGEGLSRVHAEVLHPKVLDGYATAPAWLDSDRANENYVDDNLNTDQDELGNGCSVLFIYWLMEIGGYTLEEITQAGGATLAECYKTLSGHTDGWRTFLSEVNYAWPATQPITVQTDNAWAEAKPIPQPEPVPTPNPTPVPTPNPTPTEMQTITISIEIPVGVKVNVKQTAA